ncbi:MAG: phosphoribosylanthranilate isomerase [Armatimonadota bacterium]
MIKVKICGLMNKKDVDICVKAGADMVGFVVEYPQPVPWNLTASEAKELISLVSAPAEACIVTGGPVNKVLALADELRPRIVQLHYRETLADVRRTAKELSALGIRTIKALRFDKSGNCDFEITDPVLAARELSRTEIAAIVVDSYTEARPGGSGIVVDLSTFKTVQRESEVPVILAGGLNPDNIASIAAATNPFGVDVLTGAETAPGRKDESKIVQLMEALSSHIC